MDKNQRQCGISVERFINSVFQSNSYVVHDSSCAIIIDIGDYAPLKAFVDSYRLSVKAVLITHTHYDHIYGIREFMRDYPGIPVFTSAFGKEAFGLPNRNFSRYHDDAIEIVSDDIHILRDGDTLVPFGSCCIKAMATPGHDESCLSFIAGSCLFTGDSYIPGTKVIASFPKSDRIKAKLWYGRLEKMAEEFSVYPGHGESHVHIS